RRNLARKRQPFPRHPGAGGGRSRRPRPGDGGRAAPASLLHLLTAETDRFADARARMVDRQLRARGIDDERVLEAMAAVPRDRFVPERWRRRAYDDGALPIGHGQTISQPWVVAAICQGLELEGPERVLEVGTGSGYSAAVLA